MTDADKLEREFRAGRLVRPSADRLNVVDLGNALAAAAGAPVRDLTQGAETIAEMLGPAEHLVFVAADGFGMALVNALDADSFPKRHLAATLSTVFPSTTASAFASIATGEWPARHAAVGWYTYVPAARAVTTIIPFVRSIDERPLADLGVALDEAFPVPSRLNDITAPGLFLLPSELVDTTFSRYLGGDTPRAGYESLEQAVERISVRARESGLTFTHLYIPDVDHSGHENGFSHPRTLQAAAELGRTLQALSDAVAGRARIVVTSDHGGLDARPDETHVVAPSDPLMTHLEREPSGDSRVAYLNVRQGEERTFADAFRQRLGNRFLLLTTDEAVEMELLGPGPLSDETRRRLGSHVAVSTGADILLYDWPSRSADDPPFPGHHSGLTPAEMLVPLLIA